MYQQNYPYQQNQWNMQNEFFKRFEEYVIKTAQNFSDDQLNTIYKWPLFMAIADVLQKESPSIFDQQIKLGLNGTL